MDVSLPSLLLGVAVLLLASVLASKASSRFGVPALLLFLAVGMFAGSDGPGGIAFDYPRLAQSLGIVALAFILFEALTPGGKMSGQFSRWVWRWPLWVSSSRADSRAW
jgi:NhaP-type Na+/H+ and K+/H+ antiporter